MQTPSELDSVHLLSVKQAAALTGIAAKTLYNLISDPLTRESMPPRTYVPGMKNRVYFSRRHVLAWLENLAYGYTTAKGTPSATVEAPKRGRGRPRKSEAVARQLYGNAN